MHRALIPIAITVALPLSVAAAVSRGGPSLEDSFQPVREAFLARVAGHTIDTALARDYLSRNQIDALRVLPDTFTIARTTNVSHRFNETEHSLPDANTAVLRFRADLTSVGEIASTGEVGTLDQPDLLFTVVFALRGGEWRLEEHSAVWEIDRMLPPNDLRYGMRPFNRELGERLNSLPDWP